MEPQQHWHQEKVQHVLFSHPLKWIKPNLNNILLLSPLLLYVTKECALPSFTISNIPACLVWVQVRCWKVNNTIWCLQCSVNKPFRGRKRMKNWIVFTFVFCCLKPFLKHPSNADSPHPAGPFVTRDCTIPNKGEQHQTSGFRGSIKMTHSILMWGF